MRLAEVRIGEDGLEIFCHLFLLEILGAGALVGRLAQLGGAGGRRRAAKLFLERGEAALSKLHSRVVHFHRCGWCCRFLWITSQEEVNIRLGNVALFHCAKRLSLVEGHISPKLLVLFVGCANADLFSHTSPRRKPRRRNAEVGSRILRHPLPERLHALDDALSKGHLGASTYVGRTVAGGLHDLNAAGLDGGDPAASLEGYYLARGCVLPDLTRARSSLSGLRLNTG